MRTVSAAVKRVTLFSVASFLISAPSVTAFISPISRVLITYATYPPRSASGISVEPSLIFFLILVLIPCSLRNRAVPSVASMLKPRA